MMDPLISVVIPAFNVEEYIEESLMSILAQTYQNFEVFVVNDGSTDRTLDVINRIAELDQRITVIDQLNAGCGAARNSGLALCTGKYLYFFDADDRVTSVFFEEAVKRMEAEELDILTFNARSFMGEKNVESGFNSDTYIRSIPDGTKNPIAYFLETGQFKSPVWLYFYRRDFLEKNQLIFNGSILHEDEAFSLIACVTSKHVDFLPVCYFERRVRENSIMTSEKTFRNTFGYFEVFKDTAKWFFEFKKNHDISYSPAVEERIAMFYLWALRGAIKQRKLIEFRKLVISELKLILRYVPTKNALSVLFPLPIAKILST